jgi:hypothetical protein
VLCWWLWSVPSVGYYVDVSIDEHHGCAIRQSGRPDCWWWQRPGVQEDPHVSVRAIAVGSRHTCAITDHQETVCWGGDAFGQSRPPAVALTTLAAAGEVTCGLDPLGRITCWGDAPASPLIDEGPFVDLQVTRWRICGQRPDETWRCAPIGPFAALDDGQPFGPVAAMPTPQSPADPWSYGTADDTWAPVEAPPEGLWAWSASTLQACGLDATDRVRCFGRAPFPSLLDEPLSRLDIGAHGGCGIDANRQIACFGYGWNEPGRGGRRRFLSGVVAAPGTGALAPLVGPVPEWDDPGRPSPDE